MLFILLFSFAVVVNYFCMFRLDIRCCLCCIAIGDVVDKVVVVGQFVIDYVLLVDEVVGADNFVVVEEVVVVYR